MSSKAVEPGTRLVDRYRLEEPLGEGGGTAVWRAHDEVLDRPVGIRLLSGDRSAPALEAARAAAALSDPRFLRVLDANEDDGITYVVTEWVPAETLTALVAEEPLRPDEAQRLALEVAEAVAAAHAQGLAHLCLVPDAVLRTAIGQVKVSGLAVDAAALGMAADAEPAAQRDARGCAAILYTALTGRWPADEAGCGEPVPVPPAPRENGRLCSPRQVRPHIPADLDRITLRGLLDEPPGPPLRSPAEVAEALATSAVTTRIPVLSGAPEAQDGPAVDDDRRGGRRGWAAQLGWTIAVLLLAAGMALAGWQVALALRDGGDSSGGGQPSARPHAAIAVTSAKDFDPEGDGTENGDRVDRVFDKDPSTVWHTKTYNDPFGPKGLKDGVGVVLDLGSVRDVGQVVVTLDGSGTDLQLRAADNEGSRLADYAEVASVTDAGTTATFDLARPVRARYLLLWLTKLPRTQDGYRGGVAEVVVRS